LATSFLVWLPFGAKAQTYVNQKLLLTDYKLLPQLNHSQTKIDNQENIYYLGTTVNTTTLNTELTITKRDGSGALVWQTNYSYQANLNTTGVDFEFN
jgi:hypothetical protein